MKKTIHKVSVLVITYNHKNYIREALDGILMQKVDFDYNLVIHDDASPDGTQAIIKDYQKKYPDIIDAICQKQNLFSRGIKRYKYIKKYLTGDYIAYCEGDDYWTDPYKLQKQVDFLDKNPDYVGSGHGVTIINSSGELIDLPGSSFNKSETYTFTMAQAKEGKIPAQISSLVIRNIWKTIDLRVLKLYQNVKANGDRKLAFLLTVYGKVYCYEDQMAVYRYVTEKGTSFSARMIGKNLSVDYYRTLVEIERFAKEAFSIHFYNKQNRINAISIGLKFLLKNPSLENFKTLIEIKKIEESKFWNLFFIAVLYTVRNILKNPF